MSDPEWLEKHEDYERDKIEEALRHVEADLAATVAHAGQQPPGEQSPSVGEPYDADAFMPVKEAREQMDTPCGCAEWTRIKKANPWLRFDPKAKKNRPRVHRADVARLKKGKFNPDTFELLDAPGTDLPSLTELTEDYLADMYARKSQIKAENQRKSARE